MINMMNRQTNDLSEVEKLAYAIVNRTNRLTRMYEIDAPLELIDFERQGLELLIDRCCGMN